MTVVLDSSAVLAMLWGEPGGERVAADLGDAVLPSVNLAEVVGKLMERGFTEDEIGEVVDGLEADVVVLLASHGRTAGLLRASTRGHGLSLGDRCCLAVAIEAGARVLTADRAWSDLDLGIEIEVIR